MRRFLPGDDIWLIPKTIGCPSVCWNQPHGVVIFGGPAPYVTVRLDNEEHDRQMHENNVVRHQPNPPAPRPSTAPRKPIELPAGMEEVTLW